MYLVKVIKHKNMVHIGNDPIDLWWESPYKLPLLEQI